MTTDDVSTSRVAFLSPSLEELARASDRVLRLPLRAPADLLYHQALAALHGLVAAACAAEQAGASLAQMREATSAARAFHGQHSSVLAHTQTWPRGYPGDFELIERLMEPRAKGEPGTIAHALDYAILQLPVVWQHRAKVAWQAQLVRRRLRGSTDEVRVLSIACGGSRDLVMLEPPELARLSVVLVDMDAAALALSQTRLNGAVRDLRCVEGNVLRVTNRLRALGPFDVILVGGLLDYLAERAAAVLIKHALSMLAPGALLGFTNIASTNPWRLLLELVADWALIARDEPAMSRLLPVTCTSSTLTLDETQLTWLMTVAG